ncbi:hypothetical protein [Zunongwangia pacifica]|uniref:Phosphate-selective porin O and P n=1 Tax=Zunongwangia pacifica TaxID=2911062 RepID=A0A9X2A019_9FLAO|nr:hypothetical protein [Zunongwangia pacifica]MCL6219581.1 hypothetical protein [Zunongwangia pacifica]
MEKTLLLQFYRLILGTAFLIFSFPILAQETKDSEKPKLKLGGALRFNYNLSSWKEGQKDRGGDFGYDMFRINAEGSYKSVFINAEYRLYSEAFGGGFLKQGWIGYKFNQEDQIHIGLTQIPFGLQQYNSHNWFFNLTYYMGLEDDHDMGIKYIHDSDRIQYQLAFFKNAEELQFGSTTEVDPSRYSYDIAGRNKEINQFNGKFIYKLGKDRQHQLGTSVQYGGIYNLDTKETGNHHGFALHYEFLGEKWNVKAQGMIIDHNLKTPDTISDKVLQFGAYGATYEVAAKFNLYSLAISRRVPVEIGPISNLEFYNDFGFMDKAEDDFEDSYMNVTGVLITSGNVYTYIDYAAGYNHSWLGGNFVDDFSKGNPDAKWEARFNINIGYYF